jgi:hypothetical protein
MIMSEEDENDIEITEEMEEYFDRGSDVENLDELDFLFSRMEDYEDPENEELIGIFCSTFASIENILLREEILGQESPIGEDYEDVGSWLVDVYAKNHEEINRLKDNLKEGEGGE